jgi:hypothetical protein
MMRWCVGARCVLVTLLPLLLLGCGAPRYAANWDELEQGMTRAQVESALGKPDVKVQIDRGQGRVLRARWEYGESSGQVGSVAGLGLAPPDDVFVVSFGADGRVTGLRRPLVGRYAEPPGPDAPAGQSPD